MSSRIAKAREKERREHAKWAQEGGPRNPQQKWGIDAAYASHCDNGGRKGRTCPGTQNKKGSNPLTGR